MVRRKNSFTMIELIAVIAILGILAVVAVPKYVDLQDEAADAQADGVYGAAQAATSMSYADSIAGSNDLGYIKTGQDLLDAMEGTPEGWSEAGTIGTNGISATINNVDYNIYFKQVETPSQKANLGKGLGF